VNISPKVLLGSNWMLSPEGKPYFDLCRDINTVSPEMQDAMRMAMRAGFIRWCFDKARIWPELVVDG
jgi:hypothetical protein